MNVDHWLESIGLGQYAALFRSNAIDRELLRHLSAEDLKEIGVTALGHRKRLLEAIAVLAPAPVTGSSIGLAPEHYAPRHLAEKILLSKAALEGERKHVTILFADLKGSMELLVERSAEEARQLLDPVLERMMEAVHHYEGTVNQVMGDGIMALFGAPIAHEDHAVRACYAALRMQQSLARLADDTRRSQGVEIQIRIGLNSGEVVVRSIGSDLRMDYTAVGQTTHVAARMEQLALPGTVRLTGQTVQLAEGFVEVKSLGPVPVKGLPERIEVFELIGAGVARTRLQASAQRGLTRFVGRDAEVEHLRRVLDLANSGRGQVVSIVGEAGVGKSRLVHEFTHSHRVQGWLVLQASSVSYGRANSYLPTIDLLKDYFRISARDDHRAMRDKVLGRVLGLDRALEPLLPALLALLDMPVDDPAWQNLEPPQRRQCTLDAVKRLLLRESQVQPLIVVFEDLHWIDGESQALLDLLVESLGAARLLLLVNYRPEYEHRWGSKTAYSQLRLDSLGAESAAELLAAFLGSDPGLAPLTKMLVKRGNPFFLEETLRELIETGALAGERGAYRLTRPIENLSVPAKVQPILSARIDRLPQEEKQLLQAAAAIGKDVPHALLAAIAELSEEALRRGLAHLQEAEFLYETQQFPELEHTFKHALTHEVTYGSLLEERRRRLDALIVSAIERLYADRLAESVERLAHHALRGQLREKAVHYGRLAGLRALERSAPREAISVFEQARIALRGLPASRERSEQLIDLTFEQRDGHFRLGELARLGEILSEARALAEELQDQRRLARTLVLESSRRSFPGDHGQAIDAARRACAISDGLGEVSLQIHSNFLLGQALWFAGDSRRALGPLRRMLELLQDVPHSERFGRPVPAAVSARFHLPSVLADLGEFTQAIALGEEALQIAMTAHHPYSEVFARFGLAWPHLRRGSFIEAVRALEPSLVHCRSLENRFLLSYTQAILGGAYLGSGRAIEAVQLLEQAVEAFSQMGVAGMLSFYTSLLAEGYLALGRVADAQEQANKALALAVGHHELGWKAWCLKVLGDVQAHELADAERAGAAYQQALELATDLGLRPLVAHCHLGLGKLHGRLDESEQARADLDRAATLYQHMGMAFWLDKTLIEQAAL